MTKQIAIELGHIFQLGTKYSKAQSALFLDETGKQHPIIMGCYGIGVSRLIAAVVEKNNDQGGIVWPQGVAPYDVEVLPVQTSDPAVVELAQKYHSEFIEAGWEVLLDDREESAGKKFNDADLVGIPWRVTIGKKNLQDGKVELKNRRTGEVTLVAKDQLRSKLAECLKK